jgi:hypothetical protein
MIARVREIVLYKMASLWMGFRKDLGGGKSEELLQRACQMRLIEIACFENRVQNGDTMPQERGGFDGALILADVSLRLSSGPQEAMSQRTRGNGGLLVLQRGTDKGVEK